MQDNPHPCQLIASCRGASTVRSTVPACIRVCTRDTFLGLSEISQLHMGDRASAHLLTRAARHGERA